MEKIQFLVQGSASEPYTVEFERNGQTITATCSCTSGLNGGYCKHRQRILQEGIDDDIVSDNLSEVPVVAKWYEGSNIQKALEFLDQAKAREEEVRDKIIKKAKAECNQKLAPYKKALTKALAGNDVSF